MLTMLKNWNGPVEINGMSYNDMQHAILDFKPGSSEIHIVLHSRSNNRKFEAGNDLQPHDKQEVKQQYKLTVKQYMTKQAEPGFDFMAKWNNNVPMPLRTMVGEVVKETKGMVYMKLHGDIYAEQICTCMKCGKRLTNPVSQFFGIGPECGGHNYVNPFDSKEELQEAVQEYKKKLQNITWEGWIIRSAITEWEEV